MLQPWMQQNFVGVHTGMSICKASAVFGVLRTTLQDKIKGKTPVEMKKGPKPYLTEEIEDKIKNWLLQMAHIGWLQPDS